MLELEASGGVPWTCDFSQSVDSDSDETVDADEVALAFLGSSGIQIFADMVRRPAVPDDE